MFTVGVKKELKISDNLITPVLNKDTKIHYKIQEWDLSQLVKIATTDSLENSRARAAAQRRRSTGSGAIMGAIIGASLDGMSGDDSVFDGAVIGAVIGGSSGASASQTITAKIVLVFRDSNSLSLEVDAKEYTLLHEKLLSNLNRNDIKNGFSILIRHLNEDEIQSILDLRRSNQLFLKIAFSFILALFPVFVSLFFGGNSSEPVVDGSVSAVVNMLSGVLPMFSWLFGFIGIAIIILSFYIYFDKGEFIASSDELNFLKYISAKEHN